jgi:DNA-binding transcriptional ArsR family regulator
MTQISKRKLKVPQTPRQAAACCQPIDELLNPQLFKALCDPTRLRLLGCLAKCGRACSVTELAECCDVDFSVVSRHLAMLARAKIILPAKKGRTVFYTVNCTGLSGSLRSLADAIDTCCAGNQCCVGGGACCGN